ncbi:peptidoglycan bridge formation glycyltransferase FemA/FemB family protein [Patescibacteria group bacterium]|nr:peptidoglycan bridge formation glycyltransferase FemA/FemB family protein [Patescibacteria group bacterium]
MEEIKVQQQWNDIIQTEAPESGAFLHSWSWGEFQKATGKEIARLGDEKGAALLIETELPMGQSYWYCPRGPVGEVGKDLTQVVNGLIKVGKDKPAIFLRHDCPDPSGQPLGKEVMVVQPPDTLILDLEQEEKMLLAKMHPKTRYNIRLAEKKGVKVELGVGEFTDEIWAVFAMTAGRDQFRLHPRQYYEQMLKELNSDDCRAFLAVAEYENQVIAANIMIDSFGTRTYLHGASSNEQRNVMAPYLLHWELIKDAKKKGLKAYDWWGIAPAGAKNHPWAGVTRFKKGFGGRELSYPGTYDIVWHPVWYALYGIVRKLRRRK